MTTHQKTDLRDLKSVTWKDVLIEVMQESGKKQFQLQDLYDACENFKKAKSNPHWKEKIRQTLQLYPKFFANLERGTWALQAC